MRVEVYKNLHKNCWSVRDLETGRVVLHASSVFIEAPRFVVQPAGRRRVLEEQRKNVHAFVRGNLIGYDTVPSQVVAVLGYQNWNQATYNPYRFESFVDNSSLAPLETASYAVLDDRLYYRTEIK